MSEIALNYRNLEIHIKDNSTTLSFDSEFGPITFSFSMEALSAKLSIIASEMLDQFYRDEPDTLREIAKDAGLSIEGVKKDLEAHLLNSTRANAQSSRDPFMQGRNLTLEASAQQVMDNLPASIVLMLTHITAATLITPSGFSKEPHSNPSLIDHELCQLIYKEFKNSIKTLVKRYKNID